jgi:CheY-like chemotaxis protein
MAPTAAPQDKRPQDVSLIGLHHVVDQAIESVRDRADEHGVKIEARHDPRPRVVQLDHERMRRAVTHLLVKGIKFTEPDRPLVVWTYFSPEFIEIGVRNAAGHVGTRLPRPPSRSAASGRGVEAVDSLGLDIALAKHFIEIQGGHLDVRAAARHGAPASMVIRLPADIATPVAVAPARRAWTPSRTAETRLEGTHVLLIEDDPDALEFLTLMLRAAGARVSGYTYTAPAFAFFVNAPAEDRPDVIVSDIAMPIEDGYSFLTRMRSWEATHAALPVPAIAVTAFAREEDCRRALMSGFDRHVCKPLDAAKLVEAIAQWS